MTLSLPTGSVRLVAIAIAVWIVQPFSAGVVIGEALGDATEPFRTSVSVAAWIAWLVILLAIAVPRPATLTIARVGTAGGLIGTLWAAWDVEANHTDTGATTLTIGLAASIAAVATINLPGVADRFLDGVSYGDERRFALRVPGPVLVVALIPSVLIVIAGLSAGPLLLADERWVGGAIVAVVGFGVAWFPLNALHRLTKRFLVFVPNGLVVHDPTQLREPALFVKREIAGLAPAPADTTAKDITAAALGLALELRFATATELSFVSGRTTTDNETVRSVLVAPTRPTAVMAAALERGLTIA
ncbi:MAG: hypothetical protein CL416_05445 [Acidimicrobiaceae bacterium]|nr:hypothetical protein [Acidimicrobiaceae bacterium]